MGEIADSRALGAVGTKVQGAVPPRFLANPDAFVDFGNHRAADGTVSTDRLDLFELHGRGRLRLLGHARGQDRSESDTACCHS